MAHSHYEQGPTLCRAVGVEKKQSLHTHSLKIFLVDKNELHRLFLLLDAGSPVSCSSRLSIIIFFCSKELSIHSSLYLKKNCTHLALQPEGWFFATILYMLKYAFSSRLKCTHNVLHIFPSTTVLCVDPVIYLLFWNKTMSYFTTAQNMPVFSISVWKRNLFLEY